LPNIIRFDIFKNRIVIQYKAYSVATHGMSTPHIEKAHIAVPKLWHAIHYNNDIEYITKLCYSTEDKQNQRTDGSENKTPIVDQRAGKIRPLLYMKL